MRKPRLGQLDSINFLNDSPVVLEEEYDERIVVVRFVASLTYEVYVVVNCDEFISERDWEIEEEIVVGGFNVVYLEVQGRYFLQAFDEFLLYEQWHQLLLDDIEGLSNCEATLKRLS